MTVAALGFWFVYRRELTGEDAGAIADLLTDERWPWQPCLVRPTQRPVAFSIIENIDMPCRCQAPAISISVRHATSRGCTPPRKRIDSGSA